MKNWIKSIIWFQFYLKNDLILTLPPNFTLLHELYIHRVFCWNIQEINLFPENQLWSINIDLIYFSIFEFSNPINVPGLKQNKIISLTWHQSRRKFLAKRPISTFIIKHHEIQDFTFCFSLKVPYHFLFYFLKNSFIKIITMSVIVQPESAFSAGIVLTRNKLWCLLSTNGNAYC